MAEVKYSIEELGYKFLLKHTTSSIDIVNALEINYNQLFILIIYAMEDDKKFYEFYGARIDDKNFRELLREEIDILVDKGLLHGRWFKSQDFPETTQIAPELREYLLKMFSTNKEAANKTSKKERDLENLYMSWAHEFVMNYPTNGWFSDGSRPPLKSCKHPELNIRSLVDLKKRYIAEIGRNQDLHNNIIRALSIFKDGRGHAELNKGIVNFVISNSWLDLIKDAEDKLEDHNDRLIT